MKQKSDPLPATVQSRLTLVGKFLYGREFRARLAAGLGISRVTLFELLRGRGKRRDVDDDIIELLEHEHDVARERSVEIAALSERFRNEVQQ